MDSKGKFNSSTKMALPSWATVGQVVLDPQIVLWATRVVRGSENDPTSDMAVRSDDVRSSRGRQKTILANNELLNTIGSTDLSDQLDNNVIVVTTVTTND
ncbi:hypothetical protein WICPIJ_010138 [Wickerhamomyces pijperi]|uniref:Uncharacterized protein n=1 Tax=Wickerhamomyces pijperi TaxID=599730 RepID=A0A9P8PIU6_WICPI|nr:hypothetical protein WICPIJ_010138 [Wickerhamomyces pijperi]